MQMRAGALALLSTAAVWGSSSGLNNIPTTDTAGHRVIVFQDYVTVGSGSTTTNFVAFKTGYDFLAHADSPLRLEWGMDARTNPVEGSTALLQVKLAYQPSSKGPAFCLGIANVAATQAARALNGDPYSYAVLSQNAGIVRLHGGYALQAHGNNSAILGIDCAVKVAKRDLILRADAIQIERGNNWAASAGGIYVAAKHFAIEAWLTQPAYGHPASFTVKLNLIGKY